MEIAEGRKEILKLTGIASWRTIVRHKKKTPGFERLFKRNPTNGKPFVVVKDYYNYLRGTGNDIPLTSL